jgi:ankyrin repeat protein
MELSMCTITHLLFACNGGYYSVFKQLLKLVETDLEKKHDIVLYVNFEPHAEIQQYSKLTLLEIAMFNARRVNGYKEFNVNVLNNYIKISKLLIDNGANPYDIVNYHNDYVDIDIKKYIELKIINNLINISIPKVLAVIITDYLFTPIV